MSTIYIVIASYCNEECSYEINIKAFKDEIKAGLYRLELEEKLKEFNNKVKTFFKKLDANNKKHQENIDNNDPYLTDEYREIREYVNHEFDIRELELDDEE